MAITQAEADKSKAAFGAEIDKLVGTTPIPPTTGESPTGTYFPPATVIIDHNGDKWTFGQSWPFGFEVLRNGTFSNAYATQLAYCTGKVMSFNGQSYAFWNGTAWQYQSTGFCPRTN